MSTCHNEQSTQKANESHIKQNRKAIAGNSPTVARKACYAYASNHKEDKEKLTSSRLE